MIKLVTNGEMFKFPSILLYDSFVRNVRERLRYGGKDSDGNPIYNNNIDLPKLKLKGTVKLHGSNGGIILDIRSNEIYFTSRENILGGINTETGKIKDNYNFFNFYSNHKDIIGEYIKNFINNIEVDFKYTHVGIYGEVINKNLKNKTAIQNINDKQNFFVFHIILINQDITTKRGNKERFFLFRDVVKDFKIPEIGIFNINDFNTYDIEIDLNKPEFNNNKIIDMTLEVEKECPVSKEFGVIGIGEGIVFCVDDPSMYNENFFFKSKGVKHTKSKVSVVKEVDEIEAKAFYEFCESLVPEWRLEQFIAEVADYANGGVLNNSMRSEYLRLVHRDIAKEEEYRIIESGYNTKKINSYISKVINKYFSSKLY